MSQAASSALFTDLYELTMAAAYFDNDMQGEATFSLYLRSQPQRGYYVTAGLTSALSYLQNLNFDIDDINYLRQSGRFTAPFLGYLQHLGFTGSVWALPEGTLFFPDEPILEVTAPLIQAQIVESFLINTLGLHTLIATKAARCVHAAQGKTLIDFSLRHTHGDAAGLAAARSAYIAGFDATSNVLASKRYGIPMAGTMAHSFVQAFSSESDAFHAYARTFPDAVILLIDTYDVIGGAHAAVKVAQHLKADGHQLVGVRLDSGEMVALSHQVREILDSAGLHQVKIIASGNLDEYGVANAVASKADIDVFGIGTKLGVSADLPYLEMVYKMVRYQDRDVLKRSPGKETLASKKQVFRYRDDQGVYTEDLIAMRDEIYVGATPMLMPVMQGGKLLQPLPSIDQIRNRFKKAFALLPNAYKHLSDPSQFTVRISQALQDNQRILISP